MNFRTLCFAALSIPTVSLGSEASDRLVLNQCFSYDLPQQLECFQEEIRVCNAQSDHLVTADGLYDCPMEGYHQADMHLNKVYQEVIYEAKIADREDGLNFREDSVREAQRKWIAYKDLQKDIRTDWARIHSGLDASKAQDAAILTIIQAALLSDMLDSFAARRSIYR